MSIKSSESNVESVSGVALAGVAVGGVIAAASLISGKAKLLTNTGRKIYDERAAALPAVLNIKSVKTIREERQVLLKNLGASKNAAGDLETAKALTFANLASNQFLVNDSKGLEQKLDALRSAGSFRDLAAAEAGAVKFLENSHSQVLLESISSACQKASSKIGFNQVYTEFAKDGTTRIIGSDPMGRAVITEVSKDKDHNFSVTTEVVGVSDGSCSQILDAFSEALTNEGVRRSPGKRSFTGGVCELAAARDFIRRKIKPKAAPPATGKNSGRTNNDIRRTQRLNNKSTNKQG
ncbi:MAG TPA: hypothetical protein VK892_17370 [Pyrinomonadaceae bacterium]|nr:hypothetical protein [Pyrinomonadaceae bacterium]